MKYLILLSVIFSSACGMIVTHDFEPWKAQYKGGLPPVACEAVELYEGDIDAVGKAGGYVIGTLASSSSGMITSDKRINKKSLEKAASLGGTHVILSSEMTTVTWSQVTKDRVDTHGSVDSQGNFQSTSTYTPGSKVATEHRTKMYVVIRVAPEWNEDLPSALRIKELGTESCQGD